MPGLAGCLKGMLKKAWDKDGFHKHDDVWFVVARLIQAGRKGLFAGKRLHAFYLINRGHGNDLSFLRQETQLNAENLPAKDGSDLKFFRKPRRFQPAKGAIQPEIFWRFHKRMLTLCAYQAFRNELVRYRRWVKTDILVFWLKKCRVKKSGVKSVAHIFRSR